jgi:hypothetical protein
VKKIRIFTRIIEAITAWEEKKKHKFLTGFTGDRLEINKPILF